MRTGTCYLDSAPQILSRFLPGYAEWLVFTPPLTSAGRLTNRRRKCGLVNRYLCEKHGICASDEHRSSSDPADYQSVRNQLFDEDKPGDKGDPKEVHNASYEQ